MRVNRYMLFLAISSLLLTGCLGNRSVSKTSYNVSGKAVDTNGDGISSVTLLFSGGFGVATTDDNGKWSKSGLNGTVAITPEKASWSFESIQVTKADSNVSFVGVRRTNEYGDQVSHEVGGVGLNMRLAPAATFPIGVDDSKEDTVEKDFWIAETPVTYELWYEVLIWALDNGYIFINEGLEGSRGIQGVPPTNNRNEPATLMSIADIIVWCNALSELSGYEPVYMYEGAVIRDAHDALARDNAVQEARNGFRMPTSNEWELAARYQGNVSSTGGIEYPKGSGSYWTPGNHASGAIDSYNGALAVNEVAWYNQNSDGKTHEVGLKHPNALGLFDMSGNVFESCFVQSGPYYGIARGGGWDSSAEWLQVGQMNVGTNRTGRGTLFGFRLARSVF